MPEKKHYSTWVYVLLKFEARTLADSFFSKTPKKPFLTLFNPNLPSNTLKYP